MIQKIVFITLACSLLISYGIWHTRTNAHSETMVAAYRPQLAEVGLTPPYGSVFVRSYESKVNGSPSVFGLYVHDLPADAIVERFLEDHHGKEQHAPPNFLRSAAASAAAFIDKDSIVGVIAFEVPGGSSFFLTRSPIGAMPVPARHGQDTPGVDAPNVSRPLNSVRKMSIENVGGIESVLAFYEGWGDIDEHLGWLRSDMARRGWSESKRAGELMSAEMEGDVMSFSRGTRHCFIYCERDRRSGIITTAILYRVKNWLPPNAAY